ncbi:MAG TPA: hypothetical protein VM243_04680 [Phycisphaerae bacterium]|nr:hypothetical protein [Phycisphaerae bacterium]
MLKRVTFVLVVCACIGVAYGGANKIRFFTPSAEQVAESVAALGADADPDGMAILNYAAGADKTIVQIIVSDFTPSLAYSLKLLQGGSEIVLPDALMTDENGHANFHREFAGDISTYNVEFFLGTTSAGEVWSQEHEIPPNAHGANWNTQNLADDVAFGQEQSITSIRWWGGTYNGPLVETFRVQFYEDSDGLPGIVAYEQNVTPGSSTLTGENIPGDVPEYVFEADLPSAFTAGAGATYWFEVVGYNTEGHGVFGWSTSATPPALNGNNAAAFRTMPTNPWRTDPSVGDRAFVLTGETDTTEVRATGINPG